MCGSYSREETIQGRKLYEEIWYILFSMAIFVCGKAEGAFWGTLLLFLDEPGNYCVLKYWPLSVLQFMKMRVVNFYKSIDIVDAFYS